MALRIRGGAVVTADGEARADTMRKQRTIATVAEHLEVPTGTELVNAGRHVNRAGQPA